MEQALLDPFFLFDVTLYEFVAETFLWIFFIIISEAEKTIVFIFNWSADYVLSLIIWPVKCQKIVKVKCSKSNPPFPPSITLPLKLNWIKTVENPKFVFLIINILCFVIIN